MEIFKLDHEFEFSSKEEYIELRKNASDFLRNATSEAKVDKCYNCKAPNPQLCNSHYVPAFVLRNLEEKGKIFNNKKIMANNLGDEDSGIANSGTFRIICRGCDSTIFSAYENPDNYKGKITQEMMAQIAMKCNLKHIYKKYNETSIYRNMRALVGQMPFVPINIDETNKLDLRENERDFKFAKKVSLKSFGNEYYEIIRIQLPYEVLFAAQDSIALTVDFDDRFINDIHNMDPKYKIRKLYLIVFPINGKTEISMFIESKDSSRYRNFYKHFRTISTENQLIAINYILLMCSEEIFFSKRMPEEILNNPNVRNAARTTSTAVVSEAGQDTRDLLVETFSFSRMNELPNMFVIKDEEKAS